MDREKYVENLGYLKEEYPEKKFFTVKEASEILGVSQSTLYEAIHYRKNPFPSTKVGGCIRISITALARQMG